MTSTTIPGAGLQGYWAEGESGWKPGMDENLARLSALVSLSVPSLTASLSPGAGVQMAPAGHASAGAVSVYMNGAWWHYQPAAGARAWVRDIKSWAIFDGAAWVPENVPRAVDVALPQPFRSAMPARPRLHQQL